MEATDIALIFLRGTRRVPLHNKQKRGDCEENNGGFVCAAGCRRLPEIDFEESVSEDNARILMSRLAEMYGALGEQGKRGGRIGVLPMKGFVITPTYLCFSLATDLGWAPALFPGLEDRLPDLREFVNSKEFISAVTEAMKIRVISCLLQQLSNWNIKDPEKSSALLSLAEVLFGLSHDGLDRLTRAVRQTRFQDIPRNREGDRTVRRILKYGGMRYSAKNMHAYDISVTCLLKTGLISAAKLRLESGKLLAVWNATAKLLADPGEEYGGAQEFGRMKIR